MFSMTEAAGALIVELLERDEMPEDAVVRLERDEGELRPPGHTSAPTTTPPGWVLPRF